MKSSASIRKRFASAAVEADPTVTLDPKGYAVPVERNFSHLVNLADVRRDFGTGAGNEFAGDRPKIAAAHSSAALVVNSLGPWRSDPSKLRLLGRAGFSMLRFEEKCPAVPRGMPPHLDALAISADRVVAVESKCIEYLSSKPAKFAKAYDAYWEGRSLSNWHQAMEKLKANPNRFAYLDAAQLVKHYMGLRRRYEKKDWGRNSTDPVILLYLYWEPDNADELEPFLEHRAEIEEFAMSVGDEFVAFESLSYPALWRDWQSTGDSATRRHVRWLQARYRFPV